MKNIIVISAALFAASLSHADKLQEVRTITTVFSESASTAGFYTQEGLPQCKWGIMFIDMRDSSGNEKQSGTAQFSLALTAKTAKFNVTRMDYVVAEDGTCRLTGMHIN